jgi:hypothetical protein
MLKIHLLPCRFSLSPVTYLLAKMSAKPGETAVVLRRATASTFPATRVCEHVAGWLKSTPEMKDENGQRVLNVQYVFGEWNTYFHQVANTRENLNV